MVSCFEKKLKGSNHRVFQLWLSDLHYDREDFNDYPDLTKAMNGSSYQMYLLIVEYVSFILQ